MNAWVNSRKTGSETWHLLSELGWAVFDVAQRQDITLMTRYLCWVCKCCSYGRSWMLRKVTVKCSVNAEWLCFQCEVYLCICCFFFTNTLLSFTKKNTQIEGLFNVQFSLFFHVVFFVVNLLSKIKPCLNIFKLNSLLFSSKRVLLWKAVAVHFNVTAHYRTWNLTCRKQDWG